MTSKQNYVHEPESHAIRETTHNRAGTDSTKSGPEQTEGMGDWLRDKAKQVEKTVGDAVQNIGLGTQESGQKVQEHAKKGSHEGTCAK